MTLTTTNVTSNLTGDIVLNLLRSDLDVLKLDTTLGFNGATYITYDSGIVTDSNDLSLIETPNGSTQEVVLLVIPLHHLLFHTAWILIMAICC